MCNSVLLISEIQLSLHLISEPMKNNSSLFVHVIQMKSRNDVLSHEVSSSGNGNSLTEYLVTFTDNVFCVNFSILQLLIYYLDLILHMWMNEENGNQLSDVGERCPAARSLWLFTYKTVTRIRELLLTLVALVPGRHKHEHRWQVAPAPSPPLSTARPGVGVDVAFVAPKTCCCAASWATGPSCSPQPR